MKRRQSVEWLPLSLYITFMLVMIGAAAYAEYQLLKRRLLGQ